MEKRFLYLARSIEANAPFIIALCPPSTVHFILICIITTFVKKNTMAHYLSTLSVYDDAPHDHDLSGNLKKSTFYMRQAIERHVFKSSVSEKRWITLLTLIKMSRTMDHLLPIIHTNTFYQINLNTSTTRKTLALCSDWVRVEQKKNQNFWNLKTSESNEAINLKILK